MKPSRVQRYYPGTTLAHYCVYLLKDGKKIVYVGSTIDLEARLRDHPILRRGCKLDVYYYTCQSRAHMLQWEERLIRSFKPKFNTRVNNYVSIPLSQIPTDAILVNFTATETRMLKRYMASRRAYGFPIERLIRGCVRIALPLLLNKQVNLDEFITLGSTDRLGVKSPGPFFSARR